MIATAEMLVDSQSVDAFATRLTGILNSGALALGLSIGHRTGLFDALEALPPTTSEQIADHAGLNERYVREWLGAMVTGGVVSGAARGNLSAMTALPREATSSPRSLVSHLLRLAISSAL